MRCGAAMALGIACAGTGSKVVNEGKKFWYIFIDFIFKMIFTS